LHLNFRRYYNIVTSEEFWDKFENKSEKSKAGVLKELVSLLRSLKGPSKQFLKIRSIAGLLQEHTNPE